jgi:plasmid stability protein
MPKMIQIRNVPDRLHRELTRRAKARNQTLTDYLQGILEREVARPPVEDVLAMLDALEPVDLGAPAAELVRAARREAGR